VELTDSPEFILGVAIIRGRPVPVIDAHVVLGGDPEASGRYVTLAIDGRLVALAVDEVLEVQEIDPMELDLLPPLLAGSTDGRDPITLLGELDAHVLAVLSAGRLLASGDDGWLGRVAIPTIESDVS
ncbi:MAG: chemotaxis protein CheW, partial [Acidimicrobiales bacterium]